MTWRRYITTLWLMTGVFVAVEGGNDSWGLSMLAGFCLWMAVKPRHDRRLDAALKSQQR